MIEVRVPATSANVGPGFDCMGIAMSLYGVYRFTLIEEGLIIRGCPKEWQNEQNLVYQSCLRVFEHLHLPVPPLQIDIQADVIPLARGLGSSAACIVAGLLGANALCNHRLSKEELLAIANEIEGHPDNVAPALYGGLTVSFQDAGKVWTTPLCEKHGVLTWYISGSGSTMMAISDDENVLKDLSRDVIARYPKWQVHCIGADDTGAQVCEVLHG